MRDQDCHIENLKTSINAKKAPLSLAKARIAMRAKVSLYRVAHQSSGMSSNSNESSAQQKQE